MASVLSPAHAHVTPRRRLPGEWRYLDMRRTHEVRAAVREDARGYAFEVTELAAGSPVVVSARTPFAEPWESKFHVAELEARLAMLGEYVVLAAGESGWRRVRGPPGAPRMDLRGVDLGKAAPGAIFHCLHDGVRAQDRLIMSLPRASDLVAVADLRYAFPDVSAGHLEMLHEGVPRALARSLLAREHLVAHEDGFAKLVMPHDFAFAYGAGWQQTLVAAMKGAVLRVDAGLVGPGAGPAIEEESGPVITDFDGAFRDPRLLAVHRRYLSTAEEQSMLSSSDAVIRHAIALKRRGASPAEQHLLTLLEASLLVRRAFLVGTPVDPGAARVVRRRAYYL